MENKAITLGDLLAMDAARLLRRRSPSAGWVELLGPVIERQTARSEGAERFKRVDGVPRPSRDIEVEYSPDVAEDGLFEGGEPLEPLVRDRLRGHVGSAVDSAVIHRDRRADSIARSARADAIAVGRDIFFRTGAFEPQTPKGLGLIGHELSHLAASDERVAAPSRTRGEGISEEERTARIVEQTIVRQAVSPRYAPTAVPQRVGPAPVSSAPPAPLSSAPPTPTSIRAMKADVDRAPADAPPAPQPAPDFESMRRTLYRDIMNQLKVDFERGA